MSAPLLEWPAFGQAMALPSGEVHYERGIWGKVQGARSDFRWIARSSDLEREEPELARLLSLGAEDEPDITQLWLRSRQGSRWYAAGLYPSRAQDASGRTGFLEKQVLAWSPPPGTPAVLGALLLLPEASSLNADIWWGRSEDLGWDDPRFSLQLPPAAHEPLQFRPEDLAAILRQGVNELRELVPPNALKSLYAQILERRRQGRRPDRPAWLTGLQRPLPSRALAALLLPLHRDVADSLSLAGWLPSSRASIEDLAARWDVIVAPHHRMDLVHPLEVGPEAEERGEYLATALLEINPEWASYGTRPAPLEPLDTNLFAETFTEPPRVHEEPPLSPLTELHPGARIPLPIPPRPSDFLKELHAFACTVDRRWPDLDRWSHKSVVQPEPIPETLFPSWIDRLRKQKPDHVDAEQWRVKLDLVRSAALLLQPKADMLAVVGLPESNLVPVLLFFLLPGKRDLLAEMSQDALRQALRQSLSCAPNPWTRWLRKELANWPTKKTWLKSLIQEELSTVRTQRI